MADIEKTREEPIEQFWDMTSEVAAGMLGVEGSGQHLQPMHPNCDYESNSIWFYVKKDSDLVQAAGKGTRAHFCVVGRDNDYYACVSGDLRVDRDRSAIERFWTPITAAWFDSKDDPDLTMLKLSLDDGVAWSSIGGARFGWEIKKAQKTGEEPDVGTRRHFSFKEGAAAAEMAEDHGDTVQPRYVPRQEGQV